MTAPSNDPVLWTARRLAMRLREAGIPYAMMGALAFHAYGARRMRDAVEVLLTPQGLDLFRQRLVGEHYEPVPERSRRFVERRSGTPMEAFLTGHSPGRRGPTPFAFPDPGEDSEKVAGACILSLADLIQVKLAAETHADLADVVFLIQAQELDEPYVENLHPSVRAGYMQCLEEKRREDEFDARQ